MTKIIRNHVYMVSNGRGTILRWYTSKVLQIGMWITDEYGMYWEVTEIVK